MASGRIIEHDPFRRKLMSEKEKEPSTDELLAAKRRLVGRLLSGVELEKVAGGNSPPCEPPTPPSGPFWQEFKKHCLSNVY